MRGRSPDTLHGPSRPWKPVAPMDRAPPSLVPVLLAVAFAVTAVPAEALAPAPLAVALPGVARDLARSFDDALYLNPGRGLVVDMAAVTSVDGDAATLFLDWLRTAMRERRSVRIVDAPPPIEHRIRLLGIIAAYGGYPLASVAGRAAESTQER